jgi:hypothetical protein
VAKIRHWRLFPAFVNIARNLLLFLPRPPKLQRRRTI